MSSIQRNFAPRGMVIRSAMTPKIFTMTQNGQEQPVLTTYSNGVLGLNGITSAMIADPNIVFEQKAIQASIKQGGQHNITGFTAEYIQLVSRLIYGNPSFISNVMVKTPGVAQQVQLSTYSLTQICTPVTNGTSFYSDGYAVTWVLTQPAIINFFNSNKVQMETIEILNSLEGGAGSGTIIPEGEFYSDYLYWDPAAGGSWAVGSSNVHLGKNAGQTSQASCTVAIGEQAGRTSQSLNAVAVGCAAGQSNQGVNSVAVGRLAGQTSQQFAATAIGYAAGYDSQQAYAVAIGSDAGSISQQGSAIAIGRSAGFSSQQPTSIAIGNYAAESNQQSNAVAIGNFAGGSGQNTNSVAIGVAAGYSNQQINAVAIGFQSGQNSQASNAVAVGYQSGQSNQSSNAISIGYQAGQTSQGLHAVAIGYQAGQSNQSSNTVAIGYQAGADPQFPFAVAIGYQAGFINQQEDAIAIGKFAGSNNQGADSIAIGTSSTTGVSNAIAIGNGANATEANQILIGANGTRQINVNNTAIRIGNQTGPGVAPYLNCRGVNDLSGVNLGTGAGAVIPGVASQSQANVLGYNTSTGAVTYFTTPSGGASGLSNVLAISNNAGGQILTNIGLSGSSFTAAGGLTLNSGASINGGANITGTTLITGITNINTTGTASTNIGNVGGSVNINGPSFNGINITGGTNITGTTNITGNTTMNGTTTMNDTLTQTGGGLVAFSGNVDCNNGLDVNGANLTVGVNKFTVVPATGNTTIGGTLNVNGNTTIDGTLNVNGNTTLGTNAANNVTINASNIILPNSTTITATNGLNITGNSISINPGGSMPSGKYLSNNGTTVQWVDISSGGGGTLATVLAAGNDANGQLITNIGNIGTNFTTGGGLEVAAKSTLAFTDINGELKVVGNTYINTEDFNGETILGNGNNPLQLRGNDVTLLGLSNVNITGTTFINVNDFNGNTAIGNGNNILTLKGNIINMESSNIYVPNLSEITTTPANILVVDASNVYYAPVSSLGGGFPAAYGTFGYNPAFPNPFNNPFFTAIDYAFILTGPNNNPLPIKNMLVQIDALVPNSVTVINSGFYKIFITALVEGLAACQVFLALGTVDGYPQPLSNYSFIDVTAGLKSTITLDTVIFLNTNQYIFPMVYSSVQPGAQFQTAPTSFPSPYIVGSPTMTMTVTRIE